MKKQNGNQNMYIPQLNNYEKRSTQPSWLAVKLILRKEEELEREKNEIEHLSATKRMYETSHRPDEKIRIDKELYDILNRQSDSRLYKSLKSRDNALFYDHETKYQAEQNKMQLARERSPAWNQKLKSIRH